MYDFLTMARCSRVPEYPQTILTYELLEGIEKRISKSDDSDDRSGNRSATGAIPSAISSYRERKKRKVESEKQYKRRPSVCKSIKMESLLCVENTRASDDSRARRKGVYGTGENNIGRRAA